MPRMVATAKTLEEAPVTGAAYGARLRAAADLVEELEEQLRIARDRRNELIIAGFDDEGLTYRALVHQTRLSRARIIAILAAA